jgi:hypothetical protein
MAVAVSAVGFGGSSWVVCWPESAVYHAGGAAADGDLLSDDGVSLVVQPDELPAPGRIDGVAVRCFHAASDRVGGDGDCAAARPLVPTTSVASTAQRTMAGAKVPVRVM